MQSDVTQTGSRVLKWVYHATQRVAWVGVMGCVFGMLPSSAAHGDTSVEYNRDIRPILAEHCFQCHGPDSASRKGDLRLDQREAALTAQAIVPGEPSESELITRIETSDPELIMPPPETKKSLTESQRKLLTLWISTGAEYQPHWSFIPPTKPQLPQVRRADWVKNEIDHFVLAQLEALNLEPAPAADGATLFRRMHLDLTGLPPLPEESAQFQHDFARNSELALSEWIDRLMQMPAWGEHRARYWLDAARYGDTHGFHFDNYREMWPYRDWVIRAYQRNQPYDRFIIEQLAGDLLPHPTQDELIATGFQRCNMTTNEGGTIDEENLAIYAADRVQTFGWVFLGLTTNCGQCHDHKFDPFTMRDYYSLAAFFRNTTQPAKDGNNKEGNGPVLIIPAAQDADRWTALPMEIASAQTQLQAIKSAAQPAFEKWLADQVTTTSAEGTEPVDRTAKLDEYLKQYNADYPRLVQSIHALEQERDAIKARSPLTHIQTERSDTPAMAHVLIRGEYDRPSEQVMAATPAALHPLPAAAPANRLGLALWLVDPANPLTARVTVNRFWQQVFGRGLVATPEDFGVMGTPPSHPELLDWLALEFRDQGWNVQRLFKLMLMSATYRQSAAATQDKIARDHENLFLSRGPRFRMDAEMVRDSALAASGLLSPKLYGPSVKPYQPDNIWNMVGLRESNTRDYHPDSGADLYRRTLYSFWKRMAPPPNLEAFNAPSREVCSVRRERTNTPLQALVTLNDPQFFEAARCLAQRALQNGQNQPLSTLDYIGQLVLNRPLLPAEQSILMADHQAFQDYYAQHTTAADELIAVGTSPIDRTIPASTLAAWTLTSNQVLNLDEALNK